MESLKSGVLQKLVVEMNNIQDDCMILPKNNGTPILLQVRSIVPIIEEGDLWSRKGFHVEVCDLSHSMYVCLPQEMDDLIMCNNLKLGQFIYVEKLEPSHPIPTLKGVMPIPSYLPCVGTLENIFQQQKQPNIDLATTRSEEVEKYRTLPHESVHIDNNLATLGKDMNSKYATKDDVDHERNHYNVVSKTIDQKCIEKECVSEIRVWKEATKGLENLNSVPVEEDNDSDSPNHGSSSRRRSWHWPQSGNPSNSLAPKKQYSRSAGASPIRSYWFNISNDNSSSTPKVRLRKTSTKSIHACTKNRDYLPKVREPQICRTRDVKQPIQVKISEVKESWDNLPLDLVQVSLDVVKKRDVHLFVAIAALQEAALAEKLVKCLSTFSDFHEAEKDDHKPLIKRFLDLQDDLKSVKLILESIKNVSPLETSQIDSTNATNVAKGEYSLAIEHKKNAASWINTAVTSNLPHVFNLTKSTIYEDNTKRSTRKCNRENHNDIPKSKASIETQGKGLESIPKIDHDSLLSWKSGSAIPIMACLVDSLTIECCKWFLPRLEKILDEYSRTLSRKPNWDFVEMMHQIKRVNNWLDVIMNNETQSMQNESDDGLVNDRIQTFVMEESVMEVCRRIRRKIYLVLLDYVDKTAAKHFNAL